MITLAYYLIHSTAVGINGLGLLQLKLSGQLGLRAVHTLDCCPNFTFTALSLTEFFNLNYFHIRYPYMNKLTNLISYLNVQQT